MFGSARISAHVVDRLVRNAEQRRQPGEEADDLHVGLRVGDLHRHLVVGARRVAKTQKVCTNGRSPHAAMPPAMPIMFASAMPTFGEALGKRIAEDVDLGGPASGRR